MVALLQKDLFVIWRTCKYVFLVAVGFAVLAGLSSGQTMFFSMYAPVLLTTMSMTTLSYDERSKWLQYADALPYGRNKVVIGKYFIALLGLMLGLMVTGLSYLIFGTYKGNLYSAELLMIVCAAMIAGSVQALFVLPACFALGVEKGRWIYTFCIVIPLVAVNWVPIPGIVLGPGIDIPMLGMTGIVLAVCAVLWLVSCRVAILFYRKRTL